MELKKIQNQSPLLSIVTTLNALIDKVKVHDDLTSTLTNLSRNMLLEVVEYQSLYNGYDFLIKTAGVYKFNLNSPTDNGQVNIEVEGKNFKTTLYRNQEVDWLLSVGDKVKIIQTGLPSTATVEITFVMSLLEFLEQFRAGIQEQYKRLEESINTLDASTKQQTQEMLQNFNTELATIIDKYNVGIPVAMLNSVATSGLIEDVISLLSDGLYYDSNGNLISSKENVAYLLDTKKGYIKQYDWSVSVSKYQFTKDLNKDTTYSAGRNVAIDPATNTISATDTITTINGKTGAITKADITALGIPSQNTVYQKPSSEPISYIEGLQSELDSKVNLSSLTFVENGTTYIGKFVIEAGQPKIIATEVL